ncbi:MAG: hypothetical protein KAI59_06560 [Planctomycetes bacterium]|nr:hypothetical protein [Planctomycetota bacterium]MCK5473678.1 hypothetical protein [Planctomycetota bacterium]
MIEKIDSNSNLAKPEMPSRKCDPIEEPTKTDVAASLEVNSADLIGKAMQTTQDDAAIVQKAQKLLASGELESDENIRQAAENIVKFGI